MGIDGISIHAVISTTALKTTGNWQHHGKQSLQFPKAVNHASIITVRNHFPDDQKPEQQATKADLTGDSSDLPGHTQQLLLNGP